MKHTSKTGLLSSPTKRLIKPEQNDTIQLLPNATRAPFAFKPFAGLYNPFAQGCSLLCNHPSVPEVKKMLQNARSNWGNQDKAIILPEDIEAIRAELQQIEQTSSCLQSSSDLRFSQEVPEELFRKYMQTDSRPLTPAPTLASAQTRASAGRRCVTPDPITSLDVREKTLLVLDLRKSHSQETLSWYGSQNTSEPPLIRIMHVGLVETPTSTKTMPVLDRRSPQLVPKRPKSEAQIDKSKLQLPSTTQKDRGEEETEVTKQDQQQEEEVMKRRGRKRKKRRDASNASIFRATSMDPETLIAGVDAESKEPSERPSLTSAIEVKDFQKKNIEESRSFKVDFSTFLDYESLRQLRRELTHEIVEMELDEKRQKALQEALKTVPRVKINCEELQELQRTLELPVIDTELWFSCPRSFSRSTVRFELPMDGRSLIGMTPLEYMNNHVFLKSCRKLLYNYIFNIHRIQPEAPEEEEEEEKVELVTPSSIRFIKGTEISLALGTLMGKPFSNEETEYFHSLVGWLDSEEYTYKTFSGICALCERLLASHFVTNLPGQNIDPPQAIETVDFGYLEMKFKGREPEMDKRLVTILQLLKIS